ncbi:MAG: glycosyltransferase family 1 protein [Acidobacteriota bacterium]
MRSLLKKIPPLVWAVRLGRRLAHRLGPARWRRTWQWRRSIRAASQRRRRETRLTVGVDIAAFWEPLTGIGWYLYEVLQALASRDDLRLRLYGAALPRGPEVPPPEVEIPTGPALEWVTYEVPDDLLLPRSLLFRWLRRREARLLAADRNRVLFGPNFLLAPKFERAPGARVVTVHDLSLHRLPWAVRPDTRNALAASLALTLRQAQRVITPSHAVRQDIADAGWFDPLRVEAIHHGLGHRASATRRPAGTPPRYLLSVGTLEPRKNLSTLLAACRQGTLPLVLAGRFGWGTEELRPQVEAGVEEGWLHHFGYVEEGELAALYEGATAVALPSLYEGFGLPAVEAMAAGKALLLSDIPVFREVAADAARYLGTEDVAAWRQAIQELVQNEALRRDLAERALRRSREFTWQRSAEEHARVFAVTAEAQRPKDAAP